MSERVTITVSRDALARLRDVMAQAEAWSDSQTNDGENDPKCGWSKYDEYMADWREAIDEAAGSLVATMEEVSE